MIKKKLAFAAVAATTAVAALVPAAPAAASCSKPIDPIGCIEGPICTVGNKLGFQCVD